MQKLSFFRICSVLIILMMYTSCSENEIEQSDTVLINEENENVTETGAFELLAASDYLKNEGAGKQSWGDNVTIEALKIDGTPGNVVFETRFKDDGFGVAGGRWQQIDYYYEYQGEIVKTSEKLVFTFKKAATDLIIQVGQMDPNEGRQAKEGKTCADNDSKNRVDESGKWTAYDVDFST